MNPIERKKKEKFVKSLLREHLEATFEPLVSYREGNIAKLTFNIEYKNDSDLTIPLSIEFDENLNTKDIGETIMCDKGFIIVLSIYFSTNYMLKILNERPEDIQPHMTDFHYFTDFALREGLIEIFADNFLNDLISDIERIKDSLYFYDLPNKTNFENSYEFVVKTLNEYDDLPIEDIDCLRSDYLKRKLAAEIHNEENTPELRKQFNIILHEPNFSDKYNELAVRI